MLYRKFKCAECGNIFETSIEKDLRCPRCRSKILILLEGETLRKIKGNISSCSSGG